MLCFYPELCAENTNGIRYSNVDFFGHILQIHFNLLF